jgi:hypothetical protein
MRPSAENAAEYDALVTNWRSLLGSKRGVVACLVAVLGAMLAPVASSRTDTTSPAVYVTIHVTITNSKVSIKPQGPPRGAMGRFVIRNLGKGRVTFSLGAHKAGLGTLFGFRAAINPGKQEIRIVYLAIRGKIPYQVRGSFAGAKAASNGLLVVGDTCSACAPPGPPPAP